jgi:serine phosphatase RsbU (regulator of sigma subunit)
MFVTVFYGVVDVSSRRLTYARAGHDRPMLLRAPTIQRWAAGRCSVSRPGSVEFIGGAG